VVNKTCVFCFVLVMASLSVMPAKAGDPMRPPQWHNSAPQTEPEVAVPLSLQQIRWRGQGASAVINNQLVRTGDLVDGARVLAIKPDRVTIKIRKKVIELSLLESMKQ
tara:strand:+ start:294 stop:617 length:324 start_codon:yes stop_codon:yes gene_type:complete